MVTELSLRLRPNRRAGFPLPSFPWHLPDETWHPCVVWPVHDADHMSISADTLTW